MTFICRARAKRERQKYKEDGERTTSGPPIIFLKISVKGRRCSVSLCPLFRCRCVVIVSLTHCPSVLLTVSFYVSFCLYWLSALSVCLIGYVYTQRITCRLGPRCSCLDEIFPYESFRLQLAMLTDQSQVSDHGLNKSAGKKVNTSTILKRKLH